MSAHAPLQKFLLDLAAEGIAPMVAGCAAALVVPEAGPAVGVVVHKAINHFGPGIVGMWLNCFRGRPQAEKVEAVTAASRLSGEQARKIAAEIIELKCPEATKEDKEVAIDYLAAIPEAVQQSLVPDFATGGMTVSSLFLLDSHQCLTQLLPTDLPPYRAPTPLPGTDYFLKRVVGTGGFGVVYEAELSSEQYVQRAIKFCLDPSMLEMLKKERENLKRLQRAENLSPHIVRLYGDKLEHQTPFLVYEFVPGGNLTAFLAKSG